MKINQPRHPIAVIGAGIAGLTAAHTLQELGVPFILLERFERPGGRLNSRAGDGWLADHGTPYIHTRDRIVCDLIRQMGMESNRVSVQGAICHLRADGTILTPPHGGVDSSRVALDCGFGEFTARLGATLRARHGVAIGAIRWDNSRKVFWWDGEGQVFWFEDENGEPIRDPVSQEVVIASGVVLATTGTAATRIARKSRCMAELLPTLEGVQYESTMTAMFRVPRLRVSFYGLRGERGASFSWIGLEENKAPERVVADQSLIVAHAGPEWSKELIGYDGESVTRSMFAALRKILPGMPDAPISSTYKRWHVARPSSPPLGRVAPWPLNPKHAPFALAGDYVLGSSVEESARSGREAALAVAAQIPRSRSFLGIQLAN
jgi:predicted NAD/FAD-dependent oxidoreductase